MAEVGKEREPDNSGILTCADIPKPAAAARFAPSAYNIRCAKIEKSREVEREREDRGKKGRSREERRANRTGRAVERRGGGGGEKGEYRCTLVGK